LVNGSFSSFHIFQYKTEQQKPKPYSSRTFYCTW